MRTALASIGLFALLALNALSGCGTRYSVPECQRQFDDCTDACGSVCESDGVPENTGNAERTNTWTMECNACTDRCRTAATTCEARQKTVVGDEAP